jgi:hypothetical protein
MNMAEIAAVRQMFPDEELYYIKLNNNDYIVRTITPVEYNTITELAFDKYDIEDIVAQTGVIYPSNYVSTVVEAGIPSKLSKIILDASLLSPESKPDVRNRFLYYQSIINSESGIDEQIPILIKMAFPEFTFDEIEAWTLDKQIKNFARALYALQLKGIYIPFEFNEEEYIKEKSLEEKEEEILKRNGDPVKELYKEYKTEVNLVKNPFLGSRYWDDEVVMDAIRRQL